MAGWIAVSFLGCVALLMFLAANHRPAGTHQPAGTQLRNLVDAGSQRIAMRRLVP